MEKLQLLGIFGVRIRWLGMTELFTSPLDFPSSAWSGIVYQPGSLDNGKRAPLATGKGLAYGATGF